MIGARAAWGVDLSGGSLRCVRLEARGDGFLITDLLDAPYAAEDHQPLGVRLPPGLAHVLTNQLVDLSRPMSDPVFVDYPAWGARHGLVNLPPVAGEQRQRLVDLEITKLGAEDLDEWQVAVDDPGSYHGRESFVSFLIERRARIQSWVTQLQHFELPVDGLIPSAVAVARYLEQEWPHRARRLAVHVAATRTDLVYFTERGFRYRSVPQGWIRGETDEAQLARRIAQEHRAIAPHFLGVDASPEQGFVLCAGAPLTLSQHLAKQLGFEVSPLGPARRIRLGGRCAGHRLEHVACFGTALGAAMAGLARPAEAFSLIPPPPSRRWRRLLVPVTAALLLLSASLLALRVLTEHQLTGLQRATEEHSLDELWMRQETWARDFQQAQDVAAERSVLVNRDRRRRIDQAFPGKLLAALGGGTAFFRLVSYSVRGEDSVDRFQFLFEIDRGLAAAENSVREWVETQLSLRVVGTLAEPMDGQRLRVTVDAERIWKGASS